MEIQSLLRADYIDILFDQRNKNYGSYQLRKYYGHNIRNAFVIVVSVLAALVSLSFMKREATPLTRIISCPIAPTILYPPPKVPIVKPPVAPPPSSPTHIKTKLFTDPVITNDPIEPEKQMKQVSDLKDAVAGPATNTTGDDVANITPVSTTSSGPGIVGSTVKPQIPVKWVPQMPHFDGDLEGYLNANLHYPENARLANIEGQVMIEFVINEDGSVSDARIARGIGGGCDEEALRIIRSMPKWKPGKQNGTPVRVCFVLPIKFQLD